MHYVSYEVDYIMNDPNRLDEHLRQWEQENERAYHRGYIDALKQVIDNAEALIECAEYQAQEEEG